MIVTKSKPLKNIDFKNSIEKESVSVEENNISARLSLYDDQYKALIDRTTLLEEHNLSFNELLDNTDATVNAYINFPTHGDITLILLLESEELGYKDYTVELTEYEQIILKHELTKFIK